MLDMKFVRENLSAVEEAMRNRNTSFDTQAFTDLDARRREAIQQEEALQAERNAASKQIGQLMKEGKQAEAEAAKERVRAINEEIDRAAEAREEADSGLRDLLMHVPNMPDATTPIGKDEDDKEEESDLSTQ